MITNLSMCANTIGNHGRLCRESVLLHLCLPQSIQPDPYRDTASDADVVTIGRVVYRLCSSPGGRVIRTIPYTVGRVT